MLRLRKAEANAERSAEANADSTALVVVKDDAIAKKFGSFDYGRGRQRNYSNSDYASSGKAAGKNFSFNRPIEGGKATERKQIG